MRPDIVPGGVLPDYEHREAGKRDVVQTFDPHKHYGASSARFFNYINLCLGNRFKTMRSTRTKNPICRPGNLSLTTDCEDTDRNQVDDEFCHWHSEHMRRRCQQRQSQQDARQALIWNDQSSTFLFFPFFPPWKAARVAVEAAIATVDHPDIRGSKPHNRDPSGATSD
jgi:hypothetical protein